MFQPLYLTIKTKLICVFISGDLGSLSTNRNSVNMEQEKGHCKDT